MYGIVLSRHVVQFAENLIVGEKNATAEDRHVKLCGL